MTVVVNSQQGAIGTVAATTLAITPTGIVAGRSLVLWFGTASGATGSMTACSDTGGNTWTRPDPPQGGISGVTNTFLGCAYVHNVVAPGTITVTSNSIANRKILLLEITGLLNAAPDITGEDFTAATALTNVAPSVAMTVADFVIAGCVRGGTVDPTGITAGWTASQTGLPDNTAVILRAGWQEFATGGASGTCGFTFAGTSQAGLGTIAFQVPPVVAGPQRQAVPVVGGAGGGGKMN